MKEKYINYVNLEIVLLVKTMKHKFEKIRI